MSQHYRSEPWFALLQGAAASHPRAKVASLLGVSAPVVTQILNGTGRYGAGLASTRKVADKVLHTFGRYACPHLTAESGGEAVVISAAQCRGFAHRPAPTGSPRDMQHWQACQPCPHKAASAPPVPRPIHPRGTSAVAPSSPSFPPESQPHQEPQP